MNEKDYQGDQPMTRTEAEGATVDLPEGLGFFSPGQVLGDRYEILEMLGRGGMGEVWRAFDLKLRVEVGLKALRDDLFQSERRLELLRQEVRAAREVVSPNVCRIFDLIEIDGRELVSMEYVDGATLLGVLQERGPLELKEAQDIASQFLAGLEAIHKAGLVHRDVKPENIMLTRAGRVVVMDFGLARGPESGAGSVSGTPAYMAPEHAAGQDVDARADVYSAGVVLAEMVSPEGIRSYESRQSVWEGVRSEPAQIPDSPWAPVIKRAVARDRERRQNSAHTLIRELEDVTLRVEGAEDLHPYPGLASFTEEDAEYFFGREAEVERLWRKLDGPPRLLAIMGPSGAGKTSFIRAGLTPNAPPGWVIVRLTPGNAAVASLRGALTPELTRCPELLQALMTDPDNSDVIVDAFVGWRKGNSRALVIVDQFEELFTLNTRTRQHHFAALLARLPLEAETHVLLSMRDDFAGSCSAHEAFQPVFQDLTMLNPPSGGNLRRALVQPATKCGYRFEDDELVEEILVEVEGERGALPLLAFALARLWEKRDRESGLLTRQAHHDIGGVGGALARHAEATVDRIGVERIPIVRELFRNLVTAEGTRAVREWGELLSVFDSELGSLSSRANGASRVGRSTDLSVILSERSESKDPPKLGATTKTTTHSRPGGDPSIRSSDSLTRDDRGGGSSDPLAQDDRRGRRRTPSLGMTVGGRSSASPAQDDRNGAAATVLRELIDARLLTSYEVREDEHEPIRRVEIIHESLLANWPRLVRWQTQDADSSRLRDELRQAAKTWDEHDRSRDYLWTGKAFREYAVWRENYTGGLSELEQGFSVATVAHEQRRKRRRRTAVASAFVALLVVLGVVGGFWQRSITEARRAEAANLFSLAQLRLEDHPSATIANAIASLERADSLAMRRLAVEALWRGPTELRIPTGSRYSLDFSPDGRWLLTAPPGGRAMVWPSDGGPPTDLDSRTNMGEGRISPRGDLVAFYLDGMQELGLWSHPSGRFLRSLPVGGTFNQLFWFSRDGTRLITSTEHLEGEAFEMSIRSWPLAGGEPNLLAQLQVGRESGGTFCGVDPTESLVAWVDVSRFNIAPLGTDGEMTSIVGSLEHDRSLQMAVFDDDGRRLATADTSGTVNVWSLDRDPIERTRTLVGFGTQTPWSLRFDPSGSLLGSANGHLEDLDGPAEADSLRLRSAPGRISNELGDLGFGVAFHPESTWMATGRTSSVSLWPLAHGYPKVLRGHEGSVTSVSFTPDGTRLVSSSEDGSVRQWVLDGTADQRSGVLFRATGGWEGPRDVAIAPDGSFVAFGTYNGSVWVVPIDGGPARELTGFTDVLQYVAVDPRSRFVAGGAGGYVKGEALVRAWDLESGETRILDAGDGQPIERLEFTTGGDLLAASRSLVRRWDLRGAKPRIVKEVDLSGTDGAGIRFVGNRAGGDELLVVRRGRLLIHDMETNTSRELRSHGSLVTWAAFDQSGRIVASIDRHAVVRVGLATGEEPHLLLGHESPVYHVAVSPDGRWIATSAGDASIRLWPMPDLSKPPLHTLPREELIAKLKTLTNLRVVRDEESTTGWKLEVGPFPGWETAPTW